MFIDIFMKLLNDSIANQKTDLLYECLPVITLIVENSKNMIGEFLKNDLVNILVKLISVNPISIYRVHQQCFTLLGCLLLGSPEECKVSITSLKSL